MNAGMVRMGGVAVFLTIAVAIIAAVMGQSGATLQLGFGLVQTALVVFVFWSTKNLFNAHRFQGADFAIMGIIALLALMWIMSLFGGAGMGALTSPEALGAALGVVGIISLIVMLVSFVLWFMFALQSMSFGKNGGGGLWKAIGVLYLIGAAGLIFTLLLVILGAVAGSGGLLVFGGILAFVGTLVILAAWICHGIGLIMGANQLESPARA